MVAGESTWFCSVGGGRGGWLQVSPHGCSVGGGGGGGESTWFCSVGGGLQGRSHGFAV